jgi:hypothetical protein
VLAECPLVPSGRQYHQSKIDGQVMDFKRRHTFKILPEAPLGSEMAILLESKGNGKSKLVQSHSLTKVWSHHEVNLNISEEYKSSYSFILIYITVILKIKGKRNPLFCNTGTGYWKMPIIII